MKLVNQKHQEHSWLVQELVHDFSLEDLWEFPISANPENHSLYLFHKEGLIPAMKKLKKGGIAGRLFQLRERIGEFAGWDDSRNQESIPSCSENSLKSRLKEKDRQRHQKHLDLLEETGDFAQFQTVYAFENESLQEISNQTVHALLHLSWVPKSETTYTVRMAVYVKTRGLLGKVYMPLIRPFRHWIVYPTIMKLVGNTWKEYLSKSGETNNSHPLTSLKVSKA